MLYLNKITKQLFSGDPSEIPWVCGFYKEGHTTQEFYNRVRDTSIIFGEDGKIPDFVVNLPGKYIIIEGSIAREASEEEKLVIDSKETEQLNLIKLEEKRVEWNSIIATTIEMLDTPRDPNVLIWGISMEIILKQFLSIQAYTNEEIEVLSKSVFNTLKEDIRKRLSSLIY